MPRIEARLDRTAASGDISYGPWSPIIVAVMTAAIGAVFPGKPRVAI